MPSDNDKTGDPIYVLKDPYGLNDYPKYVQKDPNAPAPFPQAVIDEVFSDSLADSRSRVDAASKACPKVKLRIGIFFDGTFNNTYNVENGIDPEGFFTNIHYLAKRYRSDEQEFYPCGGLKLAVDSIYITGIATEDGQPNSNYSGGTGHGAQGLESRIKAAGQMLNAKIAEHGGMEFVDRVDLDIFGFSRGAATARLFANMIAEARRKGTDTKTHVKFLGLFDTVGSFGLAGNDKEMGVVQEVAHELCNLTWVATRAICYVVTGMNQIDLNIHADTAETVFHITAEDEYRYFFPLKSALPAPAPGQVTEVSMPGAHSDVGGGYRREWRVDDYDYRQKNLEARGWFDEATVAEVHRGNRNPFPVKVHRRAVYGGLSDAPLKAMNARAIMAGVPMLPQPIFYQPDVEALAECLTAARPADPALARRIRAKYVHRSFSFDSFSKLPRSFAKREVFENVP